MAVRDRARPVGWARAWVGRVPGAINLAARRAAATPDCRPAAGPLDLESRQASSAALHCFASSSIIQFPLSPAAARRPCARAPTPQPPAKPTKNEIDRADSIGQRQFARPMELSSGLRSCPLEPAATICQRNAAEPSALGRREQSSATFGACRSARAPAAKNESATGPRSSRRHDPGSLGGAQVCTRDAT